jgi:hypothetical protein
VLQRHKHLALLQTSPPNVFPDDGDPARVAMLVAKPLKDPLRSMPLLSRPPVIRRQDLINDPGKRIQLRARRRPPRYPGGTENVSIFATVRGSIPYRRAASRRLKPCI